MNSMSYWFGKSIEDVFPGADNTFLKTLDGCLGHIPAMSQLSGFQKDAFYHDGTPVVYDPHTVYPAYAARYVGATIPETALRIDELYSRMAAQAAISWATAIQGDYLVPTPYLDGIRFEYEVNGVSVPVYFPASHVLIQGDAIIVPVAETFRSDSDWGNGAIPYYVEQQVRFLLWCYQHNPVIHGGLSWVPKQARVARIIGNLASDVTIYTVEANPVKDQIVADRVFRAFLKAKNAGKDPTLNVVSLPEVPWLEKKEAELADAYYTNDPELYDTVSQYMDAKSRRKELEAKDKDLKAEADAIAIGLAAQIEPGNSSGELDIGNEKYTVSHSVANRRPAQPTTALIYQFAPKYAGQVIKEQSRRATVKIDVL